jgi:pimeloyl-ACP methyl ester carboxylesterase
MGRVGRTPPFRDATGGVMAGSIAEVGYRRLGGLAQWVLIRGESLANPALILLHGGPGFSETHFFRHFCSALEKVFTVVYWDQRGSGRSFDPGIDRSSMTVDRFVADLEELVDAVRVRLGKDKVVIFGHSWGSALGVLYSARFPEKVAAYVGSGQIGSWPAGESSSYAFALGAAQRVGNRKVVEKLRAIGPPPYGVDDLWTERVCLNRLEGRMNVRTFVDLGRLFLGVPELSLLDLPNLMRGFRFSLESMWDEVSRIDLTTAAPVLDVPAFFLIGRHDHWVPPETSVAYYTALTAPMKELIWFEESGHEPFVDEPATFMTSMVESVRPVVV